jgi:1-acyl-sn-glycerol-3-phosphate acyltransferase
VGKRRRVPLGRSFWGAVLNFLIRLFLRIEVEGAENLPRTGAGIVYYNHIHWLDPVLISARLPRYTVPLAKVESSRWPLVGWLLRWYGVIFITRGAVDRTALQATWKVLEAGDISTISPEGTRSKDGRLQRAKEGLAFVARQVPQAWLIPCAVTGTPAFSWSLKSVLHHPVVTLRLGRPFRLRWPERASREILREMTDEAMAPLAQLLPPEMRGDYADADPQQQRWMEVLTDEQVMRVA